MVKERNIVVCILLSIVTCGIYGLYWLFCMADELNAVSGEEGQNGAMLILLSIVTCGIYMFYFLYKAGEKLNKAKTARNYPINENQSLILLLFGIFGLPIVSYALIQNSLNVFAENNDSDMNGNAN